MLRRDDFDGEEKANLASAIAQVGKPEDMTDLVTLIRADIERVRRGHAALAAGDRGPLGNGGRMINADWHIAAVMHLNPDSAEQVLIDLLPEPEYYSSVATAMARYFVPRPEPTFDQQFRYDLVWSAREGDTPPLGDNRRRKRFVIALQAEIKRLQEQNQDDQRPNGLIRLASALAAIDGRGSAATVIEAIATPNRWDEYTCLEAAERLLMAGVVLPASMPIALLDSILQRTENWMSDSDRHLLFRVLALCPFVDNPTAGIAKIRDVLRSLRSLGYELRKLVTALGQCRSDAAIDLLCVLASDMQALQQCEEGFINAFAELGTPRACDVLVGFVDPDKSAITLTRRPQCDDVLVARFTEIAQRNPDVAERLRLLCERDLTKIHRDILSKVMGRIGTRETMLANLNLILDAEAPPIPRGVLDQVENAFIPRQPYATDPILLGASNEMRACLFRMAVEDPRRKKSAFALLGQIEAWRLRYGRPPGVPRHPVLASGQPWPLKHH